MFTESLIFDSLLTSSWPLRLESTVLQEVVSVAVKMDFFRNIFLRRRLHACDKRTDPVLDRFVFYFSDEFGSVATTGNNTGEADIMEKAREFGARAA
jgi:hypothetical protein